MAALAAPSAAHAAGLSATRAKAAVLLDADTGAFFFQNNADELLPPASVSKLMTAAVVFRALKDNRIKLTDEMTMSEHAWRTGGAPSRTSSMFVPINTPATVDDLVKGMLIQSANDAAICLAEGLGGTEEQFAKRMAVEAKRIGLTKSTFANPTGLYNPGQLMTARDMALLARFIIKEYPEFYPIFAQKDFNYRKYKFRNRNPLLFVEGLGADGLKTGQVKESGLQPRRLGGAERQAADRRRAAVLPPRTSARRRPRSFSTGASTPSPRSSSSTPAKPSAAHASGAARAFYVPLTGNGPVMVMLPRVPENPRLKAEIIYNGPLKPPIKKGDQVATLRVTSQANAVNEVPLYAAEDVEAGGLMRRGLDALAHLALSWVPL